ncbi:glycosyl transferase [Candidatus Roizmanbacteria bacterium CG10_big_fil_rev_8_21_14_0_10_39_6]|uniref:Glycosyl transferase n=1 Tax=Candidatus Roizmanbacteria bacterium CG10_big_fil_rev_8_21_14_0_10_39_6 TaxID=1974853 RepID=A0A2M8KSN0_9BACT|nr:MAG: glycosyl transferase [Candidatus Roizmanbacteria bacterium CG10_big_fil_rev_8_21_14_0_10_39_6]
MKLIVTIPAYNEEKSIVEVIQSVPRKIRGISKVEVLVYDDGSTDGTAQAAKQAGADYVLSHTTNKGLAVTFRDAVEKALALGADILANTDADNQYDQAEIPRLVAPILERKADLVIGDRQVAHLAHMPFAKKYGNMVGSFVIRMFTGMKVKDASSGFRAHSRECANMLNIVSLHTYTHETLIDAYFKGLIVVNVPVTFKKRSHGTSKLIKGVGSHIGKSATTIIRTVLLYRAFALLTKLGGFISIIGIALLGRYLYFALFMGKSEGHIQSLVISSILIGVGLNILVLGFLADLVAYNRKLIESLKLDKK